VAGFSIVKGKVRPAGYRLLDRLTTSVVAIAPSHHRACEFET